MTAAPPAERTAVIGATLVDGTGADPVEGATVLLEGERIAAVGTDVAVPSDAVHIDGAGLTLTPGLIDGHVHLGTAASFEDVGSGRLSAAEIAAAMFQVTTDCLAQGFTAVRDVGGIDGGLIAVVERGLIPGPRIWASGPILCQRGGHGHLQPTWEPVEQHAARQIPGLVGLATVVDGPDEVRRAARENFRRGASFLKMCVTGGVVSTHDALTDTQFTVAEIRAAVEEASARGTIVTVHAHNNQGIRNAVEAGVRCVEHGTAVDAETAELMARHRVAMVPTIAITASLAQNLEALGLPEAIGERVAGKAEEMLAATKVAREAGVVIGSGSDLIGPEQGFRGWELELKAGAIGAMPALVSATRTNAEILGVDDRLGTVEVGKLADLVLWHGDPIADPSVFADRSRVALVLKGGRVVHGVAEGR